jgi:NADPH:quinone reductase-like Zn-dependent oxidoreductase
MTYKNAAGKTDARRATMTMRSWVLPAGCQSVDEMALHEVAVPQPGPGEVLIRVRACSINYRDQLIPQGGYFGGTITTSTVPLSDGVGEITAVGAGVADLKVGDRVAGIFSQGWQDGPPTPMMGEALGAPPAKGMLADYVVLPASGVVKVAKTLSDAEAATLPCAGVTAWNALRCGLRPLAAGQSVLVMGTGGVSLLALQIAKAAGAWVVATSSNDAKLDRLRALGADAVINYRAEADWGAKAAELAVGGVDHVVEVGGVGTLAQSMQAVGFGGEIALIGVLSMQGDGNPMPLMIKGASLRGIFVGSASMANDLNAFIDAHRIKPVVDRTFDFADAKAAYAYQASPDLFGKVIITNPD